MRHSAIHGAKREFMTKSIHDARHQFIQSVPLLRLRGFLHALRLVEMTVHFFHRTVDFVAQPCFALGEFGHKKKQAI